ncbi:unnamed protein product [Choristocarpus tenellus]
MGAFMEVNDSSAFSHQDNLLPTADDVSDGEVADENPLALEQLVASVEDIVSEASRLGHSLHVVEGRLVLLPSKMKDGPFDLAPTEVHRLPNGNEALEYVNISRRADCVILMDDTTNTTYAHQALLARRSGYFRGLFLGGFNTEPVPLHVVRLPGLPYPDVFGLVLKYIYSGDIAASDLEPGDIAIRIARNAAFLDVDVPLRRSVILHLAENWKALSSSSRVPTQSCRFWEAASQDILNEVIAALPGGVQGIVELLVELQESPSSWVDCNDPQVAAWVRSHLSSSAVKESLTTNDLRKWFQEGTMSEAKRVVTDLLPVGVVHSTMEEELTSIKANLLKMLKLAGFDNFPSLVRCTRCGDYVNLWKKEGKGTTCKLERAHPGTFKAGNDGGWTCCGTLNMWGPGCKEQVYPLHELKVSFPV